MRVVSWFIVTASLAAVIYYLGYGFTGGIRLPSVDITQVAGTVIAASQPAASEAEPAVGLDSLCTPLPPGQGSGDDPSLANGEEHADDNRQPVSWTEPQREELERNRRCEDQQ